MRSARSPSSAKFIGGRFIFSCGDKGYGPHDAQDFTQSFFAELIENRAYARADEMKGRFRSFLLGTLKHFLAHARDRDRAQKRGGGVLPVQLDETGLSEAEYHADARGELERGWSVRARMGGFTPATSDGAAGSGIRRRRQRRVV